MGKLPTAPASAFARARTVTYEAGAAVDELDVVAITDGVVVPADSETNDGDIGIAAGSAEDGETVTVATAGDVPANVAETVEAGDVLALSAVDGQLDAGDGDYKALTDAGHAAGLQHGGRLDDTVAMVSF